MTNRILKSARGSPALRVRTAGVGVLAAALAFGLGVSTTHAQQVSAGLELPDLVLLDRDGDEIVTSEEWAIRLGKALFWDMQAGSEGMACASCHFNAGADTRLKNQISPGLLDETYPGGDHDFGATISNNTINSLGQMPSGVDAHANYELTPADLPLHRLADESNPNSEIITTTNDRIASSGSFETFFTQSPGFHRTDPCTVAEDNPYRLVEPRNTPTTINAGFNYRNFWDGRANNLFNGVGVFGMRDIQGDPRLRLVKADRRDLELTWVEIANASLASQAVGPPLSAPEMSCDGRRFPNLGKRLLSSSTRPLSNQKVDSGDSVLGTLRDSSGVGLKARYSYSYMIERAFNRDWWSARGTYDIDETGQLVETSSGAGYTQAELNFSLFWGVAVMLYERTLVSDQSDFDTMVANGELVITPAGPASVCTGSADELVLRGCNIFHGTTFGPGGGGNCNFCHTGPDTWTVAQFESGDNFNLLFSIGNRLGQADTHDADMRSIGIRPLLSDRINGGVDPYGNPLSYTGQLQQLRDELTNVVDPDLQAALDAVNGDASALLTSQKIGVATTAKVPSIRNVALTPPYFAWGGYPSLRNVVKVYNRGSNARTASISGTLADTGCTAGDDSGNGLLGIDDYDDTEPRDCGTNTPGIITFLGLCDADFDDPNDPEYTTVGLGSSGCQARATALGVAVTPNNDDLAALVAFMKTFTDRRVQCDAAPFDHPSLLIPDGHEETDSNGDGKYDDILVELPEVGASGYDPSSGYCIPNSGDLFAPGMQARVGGAPSSPGDL